jgi:TonB family protein
MRAKANADRDYIVVALDADGKHAVHSELWHPKQPLALGHPIGWVLEKMPNGIRVRDIATTGTELAAHTCEEYSFDRLKKNPLIDLDTIRLRIHEVPRPDELTEKSWQPRRILAEALSEKKDNIFFAKTAIRVLVFFILGGIVAWFVPIKKPDPTAVIPPQFAKLLLSPAFKSTLATKEPAANGGKRGTEGNLVQSFRSEQVKRATQSLVKSGAMSRLTHSDLLGSAASKTAVKGLFDANSALDRSTLKAIDAGPQSAHVGMLGGGGQADSKSGGYTQGSHAGVAGQGSSFVGLNTSEATVEEGLTADEIGKVIHSHLSEIRYCYESSIVRNTGIEGKLITDFTIRSNGKVRVAKVKDSTLADPNLDKCILAHLMTWVFPKPKGGVEVGVTYPFIFKTLGK